eukprot:3406488-Rhodomonas_salina.1
MCAQPTSVPQASIPPSPTRNHLCSGSCLKMWPVVLAFAGCLPACLPSTDVRHRATGAQARMEEMQYEIEGRKTVKPVEAPSLPTKYNALRQDAADASTSPVTGSPTKAENVAKMREHVQGLEKELRAERSSYEANMQKLLGERDQLATLLKSQAPGSQPANPEPQPVAANTVKREGDIGTFFQSFFAP